MNIIALLNILAGEFPTIKFTKQITSNVSDVQNWCINKVLLGSNNIYYIHVRTSHKQISAVSYNVNELEQVIKRAKQLQVLFV